MFPCDARLMDSRLWRAQLLDIFEVNDSIRQENPARSGVAVTYRPQAGGWEQGV